MSDTLAVAKGALQHANDWQHSIGVKPQSHEFANASYKLAVNKPHPNSGLSEANKEQESTAKGIQWNVEQAQAVKK